MLVLLVFDLSQDGEVLRSLFEVLALLSFCVGKSGLTRLGGSLELLLDRRKSLLLLLAVPINLVASSVKLILLSPDFHQLPGRAIEALLELL